MNPARLALAFSLAAGIPLSGCAVAPPSFLETAELSPYTHYRTFETGHFVFTYAEGYFEFARIAAGHFEHAHSILAPILKWQPRQKTPVLIADNADAANGFALPSLRVGMVLTATPPESWFSTAYTEDWIKLLVFHEYTHFLNIDPTTGLGEWTRRIFGDVIRPNGLWPSWMLEGLAVYFETRTSKFGRGRSPYYEAIVRAYYADGKLDPRHPDAITLGRLDRLTGDYPYFPGGEIPYLFGYHLWNEVAEKDMGTLSIQSSSRVPFFLNSSLENVIRRNWSELWTEFTDRAAARFAPQIARIRKEGETRSETLIKSNFEALAPAESPDGEWLAWTDTSLDDRTRLVLKNLRTGRRRKLTEKVLGVGLAFTPDSRYLVYSALVVENSYELFSDLFVYDVKTGRETQLTHGARAKDPALSPDGKKLAYLKVERGTPRIEIADFEIEGGVPRIRNPRTLHEPKAFTILGTPHFWNAHEVVFSSQELGRGSSEIRVTHTGTRTVRTLIEDGCMNRYPNTRNGRLVYVSNATGIDNVYEWLPSGSIRLTNVVTGTAFPALSRQGELCANLLSSNGYSWVKFEAPRSALPAREVLAGFSAPDPLPEALGAPPAVITREGDTREYSPWSSMAPRQWNPTLDYDSFSGTSAGGAIFGWDRTGKHQYDLGASYRFLPGTIDGSFGYTLYRGRPAVSLSLQSVTNNIATDVDGLLYRRTHEALLRFEYPLFWVRSQLRPSIWLFNRWNRVRELATGEAVAVPDFQYRNAFVPGFGAGATFSNARRTKLAFMPEFGGVARLEAENRYNTRGAGDATSGVFGESLIKYLASYEHFIGLRNHHVLKTKTQWIGSNRSADYSPYTTSEAGGKISDDSWDRGEGLSSFASRNSSLTVKFRGYSDRAFGVRNAGVAALDYHFPIRRLFQGASDTAPVFFRQVHGFVFTESAIIPKRSGGSLFLPSIGGGAGIDVGALMLVPLRVSLEYQQGLRKDLGGTSLLFVSLGMGTPF
jgi:hypothetical protein